VASISDFVYTRLLVGLEQGHVIDMDDDAHDVDVIVNYQAHVASI
jgi:hypothetical protein